MAWTHEPTRLLDIAEALLERARQDAAGRRTLQPREEEDPAVTHRSAADAAASRTRSSEKTV